MNKKLYVVASAHMAANHAYNRLFKVADVIEVRLKVIEALARTIKEGAFFCDSIFKHDAQDCNDLLESSLSSKDIRMAATSAYNEGDYEGYDQLRILELFKVLNKKSCNFEFRPTERLNHDKVEIMAFLKIVNSRKYNIRKRMSKAEEVALAKRIVWDMEYIAAVIRDESIVRNVVKNGLEENILYVGKRHRLETLSSSGLLWYRIDVDSYKGDNRVYGNIPSRFESNIFRALNSLGLTIEKKLEYV